MQPAPLNHPQHKQHDQQSGFSGSIPSQSYAYKQIARAIDFIHANVRQQPTLAEIAGHVHLSEFHFQRLFAEWAGVSPKKFLQYLTLDYAKSRLQHTNSAASTQPSLAEVAFDAGLSGTGRLHDLFVSIEGVTPGEYKLRGSGLQIDYGVFESPFGAYFLAAVQRENTSHICRLEFVSESDGTKAALHKLCAEWSEAHIAHNPTALASLHERIFTRTNEQSKRTERTEQHGGISLIIKGTPFQLKVWEALVNIPEGALASYDALAERIGKPTASRAVGTAIGANPVAYIIPCHRVIKKTGAFGKYHWGDTRKKALIGWEASCQSRFYATSAA